MRSASDWTATRIPSPRSYRPNAWSSPARRARPKGTAGRRSIGPGTPTQVLALSAPPVMPSANPRRGSDDGGTDRKSMCGAQVLRGRTARREPACSPICSWKLRARAARTIRRTRAVADPHCRSLAPGSGGTARRKTPDPRRVHHNIAIALDPSRQLNTEDSRERRFLDPSGSRIQPWRTHRPSRRRNRRPTAILAELCGPDGRVFALEADAALAERAPESLREWPQTQVVHGEGGDAAVRRRDPRQRGRHPRARRMAG